MNPCPKTKAWRSKKYIDWIKSQYCCVCMLPNPDPHHIRFANNSGTGTKPPDFFVIPLCRDHHQEIHRAGVKTFCEEHGVEVFRIMHELVSKYFTEEL